MYEDAYLDSYWEDQNEPYFGAYGDDDRYEDDSDRFVECPDCGAFVTSWEFCDCGDSAWFPVFTAG